MFVSSSMTNEHLHNNDLHDMANSRPNSMIIPPGIFDENNINGSKLFLQKKDSQSTRSANLPTVTTLPVNNTIHAHSSSSSLDSAGAKNAILIEKNPLGQINSMTTISSTTTDSELESEQEEIYTDDNPFADSSNSSRKVNRTKSDRHSQKTHEQEQISRRVKHFRKLFQSELADQMPELIDSYVCAYQGDILLQGKMYITDRYLCFHSRIISYVTKHVYRWEQIENVTKERVAFIFPTAIGIQLKSTGKRIVYASFLQRDQAFEKILSICSRFGGHESSSYQEDDDNSFSANGTLRSSNSNHRSSNEKMKKKKRNIIMGIPNDPEQDEVLQLCLGQDKNNTHKRINPSNDDKQASKKLINSEKKKSSTRTSNIDSIVSSHLNETHLNHSSAIPNSKEQTDLPLINSSVQYRQNKHDNSLGTNLSYEQRSSSNNPINSEGLRRKCSRLMTSTLTYLMKIFIEYFTQLYHQWRTYPIKTSIILLIFIVVLIFHSFYLIQLAYRIENRLHSLHHKWPSSNSMKKSLSSSIDEF